MPAFGPAHILEMVDELFFGQKHTETKRRLIDDDMIFSHEMCSYTMFFLVLHSYLENENSRIYQIALHQ